LDDKLFDEGKHIKDPFKVYASNGMLADVNWAMAELVRDDSFAMLMFILFINLACMVVGINGAR
jgi:hypothetical protein